MQNAQNLIRYAVAITVLTLCPLCLRSEEPYERYLEVLREQQLYDLALVYLDELEGKRGVDDVFKSEIELERGMLQYLTAAKLSPANPERSGRLDAAEQSLRDFLSKRNHPRRGEARLKLGELLLTRAEEAKRGKAAPDEADETAVKFYGDAHQLFEETIAELASILERIKGARTDPGDQRKVAYRQKVQQDLRQAQLLSAKSVEERGRSQADGSSEQTADLEKALKMFSDLYSKEQRMVGVRNYALFYRSKIQSSLKKEDDAIDGFQRIADLEAVDVLRPLQTNAISELVDLFASRGKFPLAVDRADKWLSQLRPDERSAPDTITLQLKLAKAKIAWSEQLSKNDPNDRVASRLVRDTRSQLRGLLRVPGGHLEETQQWLAKLGVDAGDSESDEALPEVKDFAEALAEAQKRIDQAEADSLGLEVMREQGQQAEMAQVQQGIDLKQQQAITLLGQALALFGKDDDRDALFDARFRLAYLLLKQQRPWDSVAIAEFLATANPGTEKGLRAAAVTLGGYSDVLRTAGDDGLESITEQLEPFAIYLVKTWPTSSEASAAASALVQLALKNKQWDKADEFLALVPASEMTAKLRRDAGLSFYSIYLAEKKLAGEETEATRLLKTRALASLELATKDAIRSTLDGAMIEALNARVRLMLLDGKVNEAAKLLLEGDQSPVRALDADVSLAPGRAAMESYRTAIQVVVAQLASGNADSAQAIQQTSSYIKKLQAIADSMPDGQAVLSSIFVGLAKDLKEQLAQSQNEDERKRLSEALVIVTAEAAKSDAFSTQYWAADTILSIANDLNSDRRTAVAATKSYADASSVLARILQKEKAQPGWIQPEGLVTQIRLMLANCQRGQGDFGGALDQLEAILSENSGLLDVQMEAARTYQAWGDTTDSRAHKAAYLGGRPQKNGQYTFWGWGKISQAVSNNPNYAEQFFEARLELARSRYKYSIGLQGESEKLAGVELAAKDITSTASLYPELGGAAMKKRFDGLLKAIQKTLGKPQQGLAAIKS